MTAQGPAGLSATQRKLATALRLPLFVWLWLPPATMAMAMASLAIRCVPFRRLAQGFGQDVGAGAVEQSAGRRRSERALLIRQIITTVGGNAPFRSDCFPQALVAILLCRIYRLPYALYFGVALTGEQGDGARDLKAHAWVMSGEVAVSGGRTSFRKFRTLACYIGPGLSARPAS
ncbi:MAG: lasso peptide biosynthesis B2 protein [Caulobacter sp.]|nr:lasso peptide biosynthesis B2 protein [Caulobacter sp.]